MVSVRERKGCSIGCRATIPAPGCGWSPSLARRTGTAARSIHLEPAALEAGSTTISAKLYAGVIYAKVHFGPRGSEVKIVPIKAKLLAGVYMPSPVRRVDIPKPQGGVWMCEEYR